MKLAALSLDAVFDQVRSLLSRHAAYFDVREGLVRNKRDYHLLVRKPPLIDGKPLKEPWFASVIRQKHNVGFYLTPLARCKDLRAQIPPGLLEHLDGKTCFHLKYLTPELAADIDVAISSARSAYEKRKWI
jgi:hypothetical protein